MRKKAVVYPKCKRRYNHNLFTYRFATKPKYTYYATVSMFEWGNTLAKCVRLGGEVTQKMVLEWGYSVTDSFEFVNQHVFEHIKANTSVGVNFGGTSIICPSFTWTPPELSQRRKRWSSEKVVGTWSSHKPNAVWFSQLCVNGKKRFKRDTFNRLQPMEHRTFEAENVVFPLLKQKRL